MIELMDFYKLIFSGIRYSYLKEQALFKVYAFLLFNLIFVKMKVLGKIKLNQLSKDEFELKKREMNALKGGSGACTCTCSGDARPSSNYSIGGHSNSAN